MNIIIEIEKDGFFKKFGISALYPEVCLNGDGIHEEIKISYDDWLMVAALIETELKIRKR